MKMTEERKRELVQKTAASEPLQDHEVDLYLHECEAKDVDPLSNLIVPQIRRSKQKDGSWKRRLTFVTTIDLMRAKADETGDYAPGKDTVFTYGSDAKSETPATARVFVVKFVHDKPIEFSEEASWSEFYPGDGAQGAMWRKMPKTMLAKCSEGKGLRRGFPKALHRLYLREEMDQAIAREESEAKDDRALEDEKSRLEKARAAMDEAPTEAEAPQALSSDEQDILDGFVDGLTKIERVDGDLEEGKTYVRGLDYGDATDLLKAGISKAYKAWQGDRKRSAKQREGAPAPAGGAQ